MLREGLEVDVPLAPLLDRAVGSDGRAALGHAAGAALLHRLPPARVACRVLLRRQPERGGCMREQGALLCWRRGAGACRPRPVAGQRGGGCPAEP
eukprot:9321519-Pyramimonas_sp.AAC.1